MFNLIAFLMFFVLFAVAIDCFCHHFTTNCQHPKLFLSFSLKSFLCISLLILIPTILVAFRSEHTGVDTHQYLKLFTQNHAEEIILYHMKSSSEYLYWGICYLFYKLDCIRGLFFLFAFVSLLVSFSAIYRVSNKYNPFVISLLFLLFFYQEHFNAMRQMNALAFVFLSYTFVLSRNFICFTICVIVAILFHSTAIFAFPLYFLYPSKTLTSFNYLKRILLAIVIIVGTVFFVESLFSLNIARQYVDYKDSLLSVTFVQAFTNYIVMYFPLILLIFLFSFVDNSLLKGRPKNDFDFFWSVIIVFSAIILLRFVQTWFFRIGWYYQLGEFFLIGMICRKPYVVETQPILNYHITSSDFLIVFSIAFYFVWNIIYFDQSALVNFHLM